MLHSTGRRLAATSASVLRHSSVAAAPGVVAADSLQGWRPLVTTAVPDGCVPAAPPAHAAHLWAGHTPVLAPGVDTPTLLEQPLLDGWLCMAVPKRKVTPSRKGIRSQGKHLRFQSVVPKCPGCGKVRLQHGVCPFCLGRGGGLPIGQAGVQETHDGPPPP